MINIGNKSIRKRLKRFCKKTLQNTPPLWTDLVKVFSRIPRHASSFSLECTNFKKPVEINRGIESIISALSFYKNF